MCQKYSSVHKVFNIIGLKNFKFPTNNTIITHNIPNYISSTLKNLSQTTNMNAAVFLWNKYTHITEY